jgi:hypothetical protein
MGFLDRLFGRKESSTKVDESLIVEKCPHTTLRPHWEQAEDFGKNELISSYTCEACGETFSRAQGDQMMAALGESVRERVEIDESMRRTLEEETEEAKREEKYLP